MVSVPASRLPNPGSNLGPGGACKASPQCGVMGSRSCCYTVKIIFRLDTTPWQKWCPSPRRPAALKYPREEPAASSCPSPRRPAASSSPKGVPPLSHTPSTGQNSSRFTPQMGLVSESSSRFMPQMGLVSE